MPGGNPVRNDKTFTFSRAITVEELFGMNVKYREVDDETRPEGRAFYPLLRAFIRQGVNMQPVLGLVDSGASDCIFSASLGEVLGIDVPSGKPHKFHAFDLQETRGFVHKVQLQVDGFPHWIDIDVVFIEAEMMAIFGQIGFFEHYQVVFERFNRRFEINTKADAVIRNKRGYGRRRGR